MSYQANFTDSKSWILQKNIANFENSNKENE